MATASLACGGVQLLASLKTLYDAGSEMDLSLVTGNAIIKCHSIVAAANSSYITKCIEERAVTDQAGVNTTYFVRIDDVSGAVLKQIVDYFYTGLINVENVENMLLLGEILAPTGLGATCVDYIETIISVQNYQHYLQFGETHSLQSVIDICKSFMANNINSIFTANLIPAMRLNDLLAILGEDGCNLQNEDDILSVVISWLESNANQYGAKNFESLLNCVRFEFCSFEKLYGVVAEFSESLRSVESLLHKKCMMAVLWKQADEKGIQCKAKPKLRTPKKVPTNNNMLKMGKQGELHTTSLEQQIKRFYNCEFATDLTLNSSDKSDNSCVKCHRAVLYAVSGYYRTIVNSSSSQAGVNMIEIDVSSEVVKDLIDFIYSGSFSNHMLDSNVAELLSLSCKWEIIPAQLQCIQFIKANLQANNCKKFSKLAERIGCGKLEEIIANYMKQMSKARTIEMERQRLNNGRQQQRNQSEPKAIKHMHLDKKTKKQHHYSRRQFSGSQGSGSQTSTTESAEARSGRKKSGHGEKCQGNGSKSIPKSNKTSKCSKS